MWVTITLPALYSKKEDDGTSRMFRRPPRLGVYGDDLGWPKILSVFGQHEEGVISSTG
jgi:hypothetical protein